MVHAQQPGPFDRFFTYAVEPQLNEGSRDCQNVFVISRLFSIHLTMTGEKKIVCYTSRTWSCRGLLYRGSSVGFFCVHEVLSTWKKWSSYLECMQSVHQPPICEKLKWIEPKINYYDSHMTKQMLGFLGSISSNHTEIFCTWVLRLFSMGHCYRILSIFTHIVTK